MAQIADVVPKFNLWDLPWISVELPSGEIQTVGIEQALLNANQYVSIYETSPLVVVGIHRLLTAILQDALNPSTKADVLHVWQAGSFPVDLVRRFAEEYHSRFALFDADTPFLQSADLPIRSEKNDGAKTVAYLSMDFPCGTGIIHYRHCFDEQQVFCPPCAAGCLTTIPAFATTGGRGLKPSINGVPPLYVIPGGRTLFESLAYSLVTPDYQPEVRDVQNDLAWWRRSPVVVKPSCEVHNVGYLHSLTFPARRVRLHPERLKTTCTRCGNFTEWGVRTMIFEMGESRPKDSAAWFDPFAAYSIGKEKPAPIRPQAGKAAWREYGHLFLQQKEEATARRPSILDQVADFSEGEKSMRSFRCVGIRTDMKAKIFEWVDVGFNVPLPLLQHPVAAVWVNRAIGFAEACRKAMNDSFKKYFTKHRGLKDGMMDEYWLQLSGPFNAFILSLGEGNTTDEIHLRWVNDVVTIARKVFEHTCNLAGDDGTSLRLLVQAQQFFNSQLYKIKEKEVGSHE